MWILWLIIPTNNLMTLFQWMVFLHDLNVGQKYTHILYCTNPLSVFVFTFARYNVIFPKHGLYVSVAHWVYRRERRPTVLRLWVRCRTWPFLFFSCIGDYFSFVLWLELSMLMTSSQIDQIKNESLHFRKNVKNTHVFIIFRTFRSIVV